MVGDAPVSAGASFAFGIAGRRRSGQQESDRERHGTE